MLSKIDIAIGELQLLKMEINTIRWELDNPDEEFPLTEPCRIGMLIRLCVLDNGYKFLERMVIIDLCAQPLPDYTTPKAKENE